MTRKKKRISASTSPLRKFRVYRHSIRTLVECNLRLETFERLMIHSEGFDTLDDLLNGMMDVYGAALLIEAESGVLPGEASLLSEVEKGE